MPATTEETLAYVMKVLKHTELPKPDWNAVATEEGISRSDNAQQKFRRMIKDIGLEYVNNQIVEPGGGEKGAAAKPVTPRKRKASTKKEKATVGGESPSKKPKASQPEATKTEVKGEIQDGEA